MLHVALRGAGFGAVLLLILTQGNSTRADFVVVGPRPSAVSGDGRVVVGQLGPGGPGSEAFRWTEAEGVIGIGYLDGLVFGAAHASGVSADGSVIVGGSSSALGFEAFRWTQATGHVGLGFGGPGPAFTRAWGVSGDGAVVVGERGAAVNEAFRWTQETGIVLLGSLPGGGFSDALAASSDGSVIVGRATSAVGIQPFRWTEADGMVGLGYLDGIVSGIPSGGRALAVSADGLVIVGESVSASGTQAFRWTAATGMVGLGDLAGGDFVSGASGVSADGSVIVGGSRSASGDEAFIWDSVNGMRSLRDLLIAEGNEIVGWQLLGASGVSADGRTIVGIGIDPNGQFQGWLARLNAPAVIPEPASLTLLGLGALGLVGYYYRRRARGA